MLKLREKFFNRVGRKEEGQGTLEYLGIVIVAAILVVAVVTAIRGFNVEEKIDNELTKIEELAD